MKPQLFGAAIAASTLALFSATPIPVLGTNDDLRNLAIGAAIICWFAIIAATATDKVLRHLGDVRAEVDEIRHHTNIEKMLEDAGQGSRPKLPTPHGDVHPVATKIDGKTVLAGVDETSDLAPVIDLQHAINNGNGRAAL